MGVYYDLILLTRCMAKFEKAIRYAKKLMMLSWQQKHRKYELLSYHSMAVEHFYLGRMEKSAFYHHKALNGDVEKNLQFKK
jgi:hypothetical protein